MNKGVNDFSDLKLFNTITICIDILIFNTLDIRWFCRVDVTNVYV